MSTIKSSSADLTLNADGSGNDILLQSNGSQVGSLTAEGLLSTTTVTASGVVTGATVEATGDTAAGDNAAIGYTAAEGLILTGQGSTNDVTIKNDADATVLEVATGGVNVEITAGNLIMGTNGKGIDFAANTNDATGTAANEHGGPGEVLDDYEEGTWQPKWEGSSGSAGSWDVSEWKGRYTKIGRQVTALFTTTTTNKGSWGGEWRLVQLPFSMINDQTFPASGSVNCTYVNHATATSNMSIYMTSNIAYLRISMDHDNANYSLLQVSELAANSRISGCFTYMIN